MPYVSMLLYIMFLVVQPNQHLPLYMVQFIYFSRTVCHCVKINSLKVPSTYTVELDEAGESIGDSLILDCEYEVGQNETGFVLKWLLKDNLIYQWIPYDKPYSHVSLFFLYIHIHIECDVSRHTDILDCVHFF